VGRPRNGWVYVVQRNALQLLGIRGWRRGAENKGGWMFSICEQKITCVHT
jgi:hypothetical protein